MLLFYEEKYLDTWKSQKNPVFYFETQDIIKRWRVDFEHYSLFTLHLKQAASHQESRYLLALN